jgi:integrase
MRRILHRRPQGRLAQPEACGAMAVDPRDVCLPGARQLAGAGDRCWSRHEGAGADLDIEAGDRRAGARPRRVGSRLASARGYRQGENPARWKGHLENLLPQKSKVRRVEHHAALPYDQLAGFIAELRSQEGIAARALEFTILTAARTGEALGVKWSEINLAERLWTVPAERMKAGKEHRVPLCDRAIEILEEMQAFREGDFVFPGGKARRPLSNMAFLMLLRRMGRGDLTAHGFRSTFSDWCSERTNFTAEVREMALAHAVGDRVALAYRRGDLFQKRRDLMDAWASFANRGAGR